MAFQPNPQELSNLIALFANATAGNSQIQQQTIQQLERFAQVPEYNNYLAYIFISNEKEELRSVAGLNLKNCLPHKWTSLSPAILDYCKQCVLVALSDHSPMVRKVAGSIITNCVAGGLIERWPEVLSKLLELIAIPETMLVFEF